MSLFIQQPQSYPAALLKKRHTLPNHLHIFVERPSVQDIYSSQQFNYDALNKSSIEAHFQHNVASSFISLYEREDTASRKRPHHENVRRKSQSYDAMMVYVNTDGMTPAWISVENNVHIPVWFEKDSQESEEAHYGEVLWFCLEEVKVVLCIDDDFGEKDEWLACGFIPQSRIIIRSSLSNSEPPQRVFNDKEKYEADRQARRERIRIEKERLRLDQQDFEHMIKQTQSSSPLKTPPSIPIRKSSLSSLACKAIGESKKEAGEGPKLSCTTRDARISLTNADPHSAASLMKYAILMAHGKRLEGEESWLPDATSSLAGPDRAGSTRTIEYGPRRSRPNGFTGRGIGTLMTPPDSPKEQSRWRDTHKERGHEDGEDPMLRYELATNDDDDSLQEERRPVRRSAAPSPSQSMLGFHLERGNGSSLRPRRSRRELLLQLQSDQDSVLREYVRVSLQDPIILDQLRSRSRHGSTNEDAESRMHNHKDSNSLISLRDCLATSASSPLVPAHNPPPNHGTCNKTHVSSHVNPRAPSLYSTMTSLASLSTFEHATLREAAYTTVEPASHVKKVNIVRSKDWSGSGSSGRESSTQRSPIPRSQEIQEDAQAEAVVAPSLAHNLHVQPEQSNREAHAPPLKAIVGPTPTASTPTPTPSKGESFLARAKCLGEKGREITSRIAEIKERQSKPKAKKEKWDLGRWKSGDKKERNGNRQIDEQDE